jgi:adenylate cyclase
MSDDSLSLMVIMNNLSAQDNILGTRIYSDSGKIISSSGVNPAEDFQILRKHFKKNRNNNAHPQYQWQTYTNTGQAIKAVSYLTPIMFQNITAGHALVTFSTDEIEHTISEMIRAITIVTIVMIILAVFVSLHMGRRISKPLNTLMDASQKSLSGKYQLTIASHRNDELGKLTDTFNSMASGLLVKEQVENAFSRYVSKNVATKVMSNLEQVQLGGNYVEASVIFADIVGFTRLSEKHPAEEIVNILNYYFSYISLACQMYQGTIDKYIGDCAMIVFGVPEQDIAHKLHAVYCAVLIQKLVARINQIRNQNKQLVVTFRIGINSGNMLAGNLGSKERMEYTVIGETVNLAARLQHSAEENKIIVSKEFYDDPDINWRLMAKEYKSIKLRGIKNKVSTYLITDVIALYQDNIDKNINEILLIKPA